jgi:hypothetical protein
VGSRKKLFNISWLNSDKSEISGYYATINYIIHLGEAMELHYYPGQHLLVIKHNKVVKGRYEAWGGPAKTGTDPRMPEEPTWPGYYIIDKAHRYHTPSWPLSKIKWGTRLKDMPGKNDVWYELPSGKWASITKDLKIKRFELIQLYYDLYGNLKVPDTWVFNDFGPVAIRWFKDLNGNKRLDGSERLSGQMFHTTPTNEAQYKAGKPIKLEPSHGCIHLKPADRDVIFSFGAFKPKTPFIVHKYHERF